MKQSTLLLLLLFSLTACEQLLTPDGNTRQELFTSQVVDDQYRIFQYFPPNYNFTDEQDYPVVFLLDADWYFEELAFEVGEMIRNGEIPPVFIYGIGFLESPNTLRFRDYTFPSDPEEYEIETGGADQFRAFLETELIPDLEAQHATNPAQYILMGHSLGGLNTLYNFFQQPDSKFTGFVAVSPSLWWKDGYLFGEEATMAAPARHAQVYIGVGGDEPPSMTILNEEMAERLKANNFENLEVELEFFEGASHSQVPLAGFKSGLRNILN